MKKLILIIPLLTIILLGCEKINITKIQDDKYPTTYYALSSDEWLKAKTAYSNGNEYVITSLNKFGFCAYDGESRATRSPAVSVGLTKEQAMAAVTDFVSKNPAYTGVLNPAELSFSQADSSSANYEKATYWFFRSSNQKINNIEVFNTSILFHVKYHEMQFCIGNWYPEAYIPATFNVSEQKAKGILAGRIMAHYTIAGVRYEVKITEANLSASTSRLMIFPVTTDTKTEMHVTWQIDIPSPVYYRIAVDVMTGEIIAEEPTIIS